MRACAFAPICRVRSWCDRLAIAGAILCVCIFAVGCTTEVPSPLGGQRAIYADSGVALIERRITRPLESPLLSAAMGLNAMSAERWPAFKTDSLLIDVDSSGYAVLLRLPDEATMLESQAVPVVVIWPDWRKADDFVRIGAAKKVLYFSPRVAVVDAVGVAKLERSSIDLIDGQRRVLPPDVVEILHELPDSRLVLKMDDSSTAIWGWRTGDLTRLPVEGVFGAIESELGLCVLVNTPHGGIESRLIHADGSFSVVDRVQGQLVPAMRIPFVLVAVKSEWDTWTYRVDKTGRFVRVGKSSLYTNREFNPVRVSPDGARSFVLRPVFPVAQDFIVVSIRPRDFGRELWRVSPKDNVGIRGGDFVWIRLD